MAITTACPLTPKLHSWRRLGLMGLVLVAELLSGPATCRAKEAAQRRALGINLAGVAYYGSEIVFADAMKAASPWISQRQGQPWGQGGPLELDARGNVLRLGKDQWADTLIFADIGAHYPGGDYTCLYDGQGEIEFTFAAKLRESSPGRALVAVDPQQGQIGLRLRKVDPADPIRNLRLIMPGCEETYREEPFHRDFLERWKRFGVLRFMDWQRTNNQELAQWEHRPQPHDLTQATDKGVAIEHVVELCNRLGADPWLCIPHLATDDYVRQCALAVRKQLDPQRTVYLEYSNETWNGQFAQARYCKEQGRRQKLAPDDFSCQLRYSAQRSVEIFSVWERAWGGRRRLIRVLSAQAANPWTAEVQLDWQHADRHIDALAIAPYYGHSFGQVDQARTTLSLSADQLIDACQAELAERQDRLLAYAALARGRKLKLLAYEGGQHLVGVGGAENNDALTALFHAANRSPRMRELYLADLRQWRAAGGDLFCLFSSVGRYSKWGSWGLVEYADQDRQQAPKYDAALEFLDQARPE